MARQSQVVSEFKAILIYTVRSMPARETMSPCCTTPPKKGQNQLNSSLQVFQPCNSSTVEVEAERSGIEGDLQQYNDLQSKTLSTLKVGLKQ